MNASYDVDAVRREFPITERMLYFDSAHQTPLAESVKAAIESYCSEALDYAGPKVKWLERVEIARERVARFLGVTPVEIAFTKNTSEGLNIAANAIPLQSGDNVLLVEGDHPNNAYAFLNLRRKNVEIRLVPLAGETIDADTIAAGIDERTKVVSLSHVTFHAGHKFDLTGIAQYCADRNIRLVVDVMQSIGVIPLNLGAIGVSFAACGCHKGLLVPQGLGLLYCNVNQDDLQPAYFAIGSLANPPADLIARPDEIELRESAGRFELSNHNLLGINALLASLDLIESIGVENINAHTLTLGDYLIAGLDNLGVALAGPRTRECRSHIYVAKLDPAEWIPYFDDNAVRVSPERDGVRISFSMFNTIDEVDRLIDIIRLGCSSRAKLQS